MPTELPIACTLEGSELAERGAEMAMLGADALTGVGLDGTRAVLRFRGARERVELLAEAESRCCNFLEFDITHAGEETILEVRAPAGADQVLLEWVRAIAGDRVTA
jgi:hypothetical protein